MTDITMTPPCVEMCRISCRIESIYAMRGISSLNAFISTNGETYAIHSTVAAYNVETKEAWVYAKCERVEATVIEENLQRMGAECILIDSLTESAWSEALRGVVEYGLVSGVTLFKNGGSSSSMHGVNKQEEEFIQRTVQTLHKFQRELDDADARTLQVIGLRDGMTVTVEDLQYSLENQGKKWKVTRLTKETNCLVNRGQLQDPVVEWFVEFGTVSDAKAVLALKHLNLHVPVKFARPSQDSEVRGTFRLIGQLVARLRDIETEYQRIGAVRVRPGLPVLASDMRDEKEVRLELEQMKLQRADGRSLDDTYYAALLQIPVKTDELNSKIRQLFDEECDLRIEVCVYRLQGYRFLF